MLDKIQQTLDNLRVNATILRGRDNFDGIDIRTLELLLLQAHLDITTCFHVIKELTKDKQP